MSTWGDLKLGQVPYILSFIPKFIYYRNYRSNQVILVAISEKMTE